MTLNKLLTGALVVQLIIVGTLLIAPAQSRTQPAEAQQQSNPCPAGSYNIGTKDGINPICKLEPTGCPYGDSIPLGPECDKHIPAGTAEKQQAIEEHSRPFNSAQPSEAAQCGGK